MRMDGGGGGPGKVAPCSALAILNPFPGGQASLVLHASQCWTVGPNSLCTSFLPPPRVFNSEGFLAWLVVPSSTWSVWVLPHHPIRPSPKDPTKAVGTRGKEAESGCRDTQGQPSRRLAPAPVSKGARPGLHTQSPELWASSAMKRRGSYLL